MIPLIRAKIHAYFPKLYAIGSSLLQFSPAGFGCLVGLGVGSSSGVPIYISNLSAIAFRTVLIFASESIYLAFISIPFYLVFDIQTLQCN
ncbi:MAG: hypothetical protein P8Y70_16930 [Candidatus Lokiarchaeota archaeon]